MTVLAELRDGFRNLVTQMGMGKAKVDHRTAVHAPLTQDEIEALYRDDWLAAKIINVVAQDMVREWRTWEARNAEDLYETENRLRARTRIRQALIWSRLYGGGALLMGTDNEGNPQKPLKVEEVPRDGLLYLHTFNRHEMRPDEQSIQADLMSPDFGKPEVYFVQPPYGGSTAEIPVHRSRFVIFDGVDMPRQVRRVQQGWGDPVYQAIRTAVMNVASTSVNSAELTEEAKLDVIQIPNIQKYFQNKDTERQLTERLTYSNLMKGNHNTLVLGGDEKFERKTMTFGGLSDLIRMHLEVAAAAADVPATRLMSTSPKGMNATGDSDTRNYYDMLRSKQTGELADNIRRLDTAIKRSTTGRDIRNATYSWNPLWQMQPEERAGVELKNAQRDEIYAKFFPGAAFARTMRDQLVGTTTYDTIDRNITDQELEGLGDEPLSTQAAVATAAAKQPDPEDEAANENAAPARKRAVARDAALKDAMPKTLYVSRPVLNGRAIRRWARAAGFENLVDVRELHVTIAYSRKPVDWFAVRDDWYGEPGETLRLPPGGARDLEMFNGQAGVLLFSSRALKYRWQDFIDAGAAWDHEEYNPHITFAQPIDPALDLDAIAPYAGPLLLGPERWEVIDDGRA